VCHGTACHVAGATRITEALEQELEVGDGETRADREFTLDSVACMGACSQAPVMRIDDETYGNLSADETRKVARKLLEQVLAERGGESDA
jgi:NADH:ubiquinone oxidoreductase subunit E